MDSRSEYTKFIKSEAIKLGFFDVGFSEAKKLDHEEQRLKNWLKKGNHGSMSYMENHFDKRIDPTVLVPGAKSVVSLLYNYYTGQELKELKISKYAFGKDYHKVIKSKLKKLYEKTKLRIPEAEGRFFVDSAPVLERSWARENGLGWIGKSTMLINPKAGTFFFIAELILNIELEYQNTIISDHCGKCRKCIEACPTSAINQNGYILDAKKCISYLTIENKGSIPEEYKGKMKDYIFGCDICQSVCPWNKFAKEHNEIDFLPTSKLLNMNKEEWVKIDSDRFNEIFESSPVKRTKFTGLKKNIDFLD